MAHNAASDKMIELASLGTPGLGTPGQVYEVIAETETSNAPFNFFWGVLTAYITSRKSLGFQKPYSSTWSGKVSGLQTTQTGGPQTGGPQTRGPQIGGP